LPKPAVIAAAPDAEPSVRLDKFLWCARFFRSRSQASAFVLGGRIRLRGSVVSKAHQMVRVGDVLTFPLGSQIRIVRVRALATRRGPAGSARLLYEDLATSPHPSAEPALSAG
jgi:ribosome-associated heat shock protein Hsp15